MSLTEGQAKDAINAYWISNWPTKQPGVQFDLENVKTSEPSPEDAWVRMRMQCADSVQETLGTPTTRTYRRDAQVWVWCYVPNGEGTVRLNAMIDACRQLLEGVAVSGIDPAGGVRTITRGTTGQWYEVVVIAPVMYIETR